MGCTKGIGVGSMSGSVDIAMEHLFFKCVSGGNYAVALGTFDGARSHITIESGDAIIRMRGDRVCGIGAETGDTAFSMSTVALTIQNEGKEAIVLGNRTDTAKVRIYNSGVDTQLRTKWHTDIGAAEEDIEIINGICHFLYNGKEIERHCEEVEL